MTDKAKFRYSAQEGVLELEGSEEFVTEHFESLTDIVRVISRHVSIEQKPEHIQEHQETISQPENLVIAKVPSTEVGKETIDDYPEFFSEINGKLKVVAEIKGGSGKAKMLNATLLFCYGSKLLGDETVPSKDIRIVCEEHGILDAKNFSSVFADKTLFLSDGVKGGNKDVKLTFQGEKKAKELLGSDQSKD
jgi:hypothetical protein